MKTNGHLTNDLRYTRVVSRGLGGGINPPPEPEKIVLEKCCYFRQQQQL